MQNWRQFNRGNAIRSYKCKLIDNSIEIDDIKFNQFIDSVFNQLSLDKNNNLNFIYSNIKKNVKYIQIENIDLFDIITYLRNILINLGNVNYNSLDYNNIIITDGNLDYCHGSICSDDIKNIIRRNLLEKGIL